MQPANSISLGKARANNASIVFTSYTFAQCETSLAHIMSSSPSRRNGRISSMFESVQQLWQHCSGRPIFSPHTSRALGSVPGDQAAVYDAYPLPSPLEEARSCYANAWTSQPNRQSLGLNSHVSPWNCKYSIWIHINIYECILLHILQILLSVSCDSACTNITEPHL